MIIEQVFLGLIFLFVCLFSLVLPGLALINKLNLNLDDLEKITLSTVLGMVSFALVAYILAWLNLRFLMYIFPLVGIWSLFKYKSELSKFKLGLSHKKIFLLTILIGVVAQVAVNAPSGLKYADGIYFWSSHGHDGVWHLALMESLTKGEFPFQNPELAGSKLQNYHFFVDLLMSEFHRLFYFSNLDIYFRLMPVVFSVLLGFSSFMLVRAWSKSEIAGLWSMFFTYFAGSFGYLLYVPTHKSLGGESIFWVSQTQSVLGNPPHASAFIIFTVFLFCFLKYLQKPQTTLFILCALLGGAVVEFKVYAGVLILGGLLSIGLSEAIFRRGFNCILLFVCTLLIALSIYLPNSTNSQDLLLWQPWWFIRTMVVAPDRLNWLDLELRRQTYIAEENWKRVIQLEATAFFIFLIGNLGMRVLGFWTIFKQVKGNIFNNSFNLFFLVITIASFFIPVFFLQKGVAYNTIQFNQYFLLLFGFLAAMAVWDLLRQFKGIRKLLLASVIIALAIPTQLGLLWQFYSNSSLSKVSNPELEALNILKYQKNGIVLTAPFNKYERDKYSYPPIPIYAWYDTGYISAFSGKQTLISDEEQVNIMGYYGVNKLVKERQEAFESANPEVINSFLKKYQVDYVYLAWNQKFATDSATISMDLIFENKDARIFKVKNEAK